MIQEPSNKIARFELFKVSKLMTGDSSDSRFAREQAQQAVKTLALEHDINIAKKATTIVLSQDAIDNLPLSKALVLNDETSLKDLFSDIAEEAFENKALLNYLDVSESNRNIPGNISVRLKFTDFPEMRTEVFKALNSISERMEELGIEPNGIKARTFGYDLDLKSFVRRAGNFEDVWVFESENEIISFANEDTQDQMLGELLTTKDNPSNASMKFFVEQNPDLEKVFNAWMAKQQKPSMKMDGLTM
ncbi:hypothetical protein AKG60_25140 [Vibrio parahaemolyticus]|uniref:AcrB/AcrD/AcrF family protein n=2 Tax=Vibrio parahaemolyticus TaxID=670 RepID=A0AAX0M7L4_VIBPH|nr:hypothetical protein [Vibrio parahaemolyticus]MCS0327091.1 hypothetical protein [Vibrio diabolicus]EGQ8302433.1 hypothetical protein [Vibrio parahaemolyticus]EGQ8891732.1 hypothetical protein [Vibrio parahaemolyticus]KOF18033.1 hypothetical protein ACX13_25130 [Vibrio parahaemolyticus]MCS0405499.1 hypothetical protein [Vibrio diabolicus]